ncbi:hypothetical protein [uncultured Methanosphaera sp.]|nr:hypothetical protein [uncultured Methanosphaera sp.]
MNRNLNMYFILTILFILIISITSINTANNTITEDTQTLNYSK